MIARSFLVRHAPPCRRERVVARRRIVFADRGARLHRHAGDARHPGLEAHDVRGARERGLGRFAIADLGVEADVGARFVEQRAARRVAPQRPCRQPQAAPRSRPRRARRASLAAATASRDHDRDRLADVAHLVDRERVMRRDEHRRAVRVLERNVGGMRRERPMRDRLHAVGEQVAAGQHGDHAGQLRAPASMSIARMRACACGERTMHRIGLARQVDVVAEAAAAR